MRSTIDSMSRPRDAASSKISLLKTYGSKTGSFNLVSQLPKNIKQNIIREGDTLVNAPELVDEIWKSMRKNDFAGQGALNMQIVEDIFNVHSRKFEILLNARSVNDLFDMMDTDSDGTVNEDEQILIFSVIKEKMMKVAEDLANIQEYHRYRDLMKAVRKMELQIAKYQDFLRQRIYKSELDIYHKIGEVSAEEFYDYYEEEFKKLNTYSLEREAQLRSQHEDQLSILMERLNRAVVAVKFKPKAKLKDYQTQEKLVSIDERVEEALNFRKELKDLEVSEAQRINMLRVENIERQKNVLLNEQKKEMEHLQGKLKNEENKLVIRMKRDFDVMQKKTHLHENEIKKIQGLAAKYAMQKALEDGELKRTKAKSKKTNALLKINRGMSSLGFAQSPSNKQLSPRGGMTSYGSMGDKVDKKTLALHTITLNSIDMQNKTNSEYIKTIAKSPNVLKFHLQKSYGEDKPINAQKTNWANEDKLSHKKVQIYLTKEYEKKGEIPQLTSLYNENLRPVEKVEEEHYERERVSSEDKKRTRIFINEKLNGDRKL